MKERMRFVVTHEADLYAMKEQCERFGISRKTGYKWLERFEEEGPGGWKTGAGGPTGARIGQRRTFRHYSSRCAANTRDGGRRSCWTL